MGIYYIATEDGVYYELSSTKEVVASFSGQATEFPLESGEAVSDHYVDKPASITFTGTISDIVVLRGSEQIRKSTQEYVEGLLKLKKSRRPFTINWAGNLRPLDNCVFENLEVTQDDKRGWAGGKAAYRISFTARQLRFGEGAQIVNSPRQEDRDAFADFTGASGNTKSVAEGSLEAETADEISSKASLDASVEFLRRVEQSFKE